MQSPCSCGHFELRLTYVALSVTKLWAFEKKKYFTRQNLNLKATATQAAVASVKISSDILFCREESGGVVQNVRNVASCGVSVVTGPWDSIEPPSEETSTQGNCVNFVWWECLGRMYQWTVFHFTSFVLLSYVMLYFTENFDEWNWPERTRSLSCSSLQVEILSGKNYFFLLQTLITL